MQVKIKELAAEIELKNKGIELEIRDNNGKFLGDFVVTRSQVIWCEGKTGRDRGIKVNMNRFLDMLRNEAPKKAAVKKAAAKKVAIKKVAVKKVAVKKVAVKKVAE